MDYLPDRLNNYIKNINYKNDITEIRLRKNKPIQFTVFGKIESAKNIIITEVELENIFYSMCDNSINIYDNEISHGYITLHNGNRVGIGGEFYYNPKTEKYILKELLSLNIRIAKEQIYFENQDKLFGKEIKSTLIVGVPHSGKTSLLKLYARYLSQNYRVTVCDERKEIYHSELNCDVLSGIDKPTAIGMATRTLNPRYIICDEIGSLQESEQMLSAVNTGVRFICSAHGEDIEQVKKRPNIKLLLDNGVFGTVVLLSGKKFEIKEVRYV